MFRCMKHFPPRVAGPQTKSVTEFRSRRNSSKIIWQRYDISPQEHKRWRLLLKLRRLSGLWAYYIALDSTIRVVYVILFQFFSFFCYQITMTHEHQLIQFSFQGFGRGKCTESVISFPLSGLQTCSICMAGKCIWRCFCSRDQPGIQMSSFVVVRTLCLCLGV